MVTEERKWSVYRHISPSGKVYIGITSRKPEVRWGHGCNYYNCIFANAIKKYGWDNFKHEILFNNLSESRAKSLEMALIRHYKGLGVSYNMTDGGDGIVGIPKTQKWLDAVRKTWLGKHLSEEHKRKISEAHKGMPGTRNGMRLSEEARKRLSELRKGEKHTFHISKEELTRIKQTTAKTIHVRQYTLEGEFVAEYFSLGEAARIVGSSPNNISTCCSGRTKTAKGFIWRKVI